MTNHENRLPENAPGPFFVTEDCIDCDLCRETAPSTFHRNDEIGFSVVYRQPTTSDEIDRAKAASGECPVDAICFEAEE